MAVLVTYKNDEDPSKNERARVLTTFIPLEAYGDFSRHSRAANSADHCPILSNFEPIQAFIAVQVTCKNEVDSITNGGARELTRFSPL